MCVFKEIQIVCVCVCLCVRAGAYEPPEGRKECPTTQYSVERRGHLNG